MYIKEQQVTAINHSIVTNITIDGDGYIFSSNGHVARPVYWGNNGDQVFSRFGYTVIVTLNFSVFPIGGYTNSSLNSLIYLITPEGDCSSYLIEPSGGDFLTNQGDDHRRPSVKILKDGRIVLVQEKGKGGDNTITGNNNHNTNITIWVTKKPFDLNTFEKVLDIPVFATYLMTSFIGNNVYIFFRNTLLNGGVLSVVKTDVTFRTYKVRNITSKFNHRIYIWNVTQKDNEELYINFNLRLPDSGSYYVYPTVIKSKDGITWKSLDEKFEFNIEEGPITSSDWIGNLVIDKTLNLNNVLQTPNNYNFYSTVCQLRDGGLLIVEEHFNIASGQPRTLINNRIIEASNTGAIQFHTPDFIQNILPSPNTPLPNPDLCNGIKGVFQNKFGEYLMWIMNNVNPARVSLLKSNNLRDWESVKTYTSNIIPDEEFLTTLGFYYGENEDLFFMGTCGKRNDPPAQSNSFYIEQVC